MFSQIGWSEILLTALVALLVLRPEDWPLLARRAGQAYGRLHDLLLAFRRESSQALERLAESDETKRK